MGGFGLSPLNETQSVFNPTGERYILQRHSSNKDGKTTSIGEWMTEYDGHDLDKVKGMLELSLSKPDAVGARFRIIMNPSMKIILDTDKLITGQIMPDDTTPFFGIIGGSNQGGSGRR